MTDHTAFIQSLYAAFSRGDLAFILSNSAPDIEWVSNCDPTTVPWAGRRTGIAGATAFFELLTSNIDFELFTQDRFYPSGDAVIVVGRTRARHKSGGRGVFDCQWAHVFTVTDGKLARFEEFYDSAAIARALAA